MKCLTPQITTIITTYNRPALLQRAIRSVLEQTYPFFQLCIYDNGSDTETEQFVTRLMQEDPRVSYHRHSKNIGMMENYAYGFSKVNTPYFSFLSDDDFLSPWFYEVALADLGRHPTAAFTACAAKVIDNQEQELFESLCLWEKTGFYDAPQGFLMLLLPSFKPPIPTCTLFRYNLIKGIAFDWHSEIQVLWDPCFLLQIAALFPFVINKTACGYYLAHSDGFSSGLHERMNHSSKEMVIYLRAAKRLMTNVLTNNTMLSSEVKRKALKALLQFFQKHTNTQILTYWKKRRFKEAIQGMWYRHWFLKIKQENIQ